MEMRDNQQKIFSMFFKTFNFTIVLDSQKSCMDSSESFHTTHAVSYIINILHW